jgi:hypothetical protein
MLPISPAALKSVAPPSTATGFPMTITEVGGKRRQVTLQGESLPFRGVAFGVELRSEVTYFPGNPIGQVQVLGPTWTDTELTGRWCDSKLTRAGSKAIAVNFPAIAQAGRPLSSGLYGGNSFVASSVTNPLQEIQRARTLRDAFFMLAESGQLLKLEWGSIVRYGVLKEFEPTHDREEDINWRMMFQWVGRTEPTIKFKSSTLKTPASVLAKILAALNKFLDAVNLFLQKAYSAILSVKQKIASITNTIVGLINTISNILGLAFIPLQLLGSVKQAMMAIKLACQDFLQTIRNLRGLPGAYEDMVRSMNPSQMSINAELQLAIEYNTALLAEQTSFNLLEFEEYVSTDILAVYTMTNGETLRDVALKVYGDPAAWTVIADFNKLSSAIVPGGTAIHVPAVNNNGKWSSTDPGIVDTDTVSNPQTSTIGSGTQYDQRPNRRVSVTRITPLLQPSGGSSTVDINVRAGPGR